MDTPTREFLRRPEGGRRRSVRQALAVIPDTTGLAVSPGEVVTSDANTADSLANSRQGLHSSSPVPSPDELVIQKRGRRRKTIVWSPDVDARKRDSLFSSSSQDRTPVKSPIKSNVTLRSTPRKRLVLGDAGDLRLPNTPEKQMRTTVVPRAVATRKSEIHARERERFATSLVGLLEGLGNKQLVKIITNLIAMQEDGLLPTDEPLRRVIFKQILATDLKPFEERLDLLRQRVRSTLSSSETDPSSYDRAVDLLDTYQVTLVSQGKLLVESQHWTAVVKYVFSAWAITKSIPRLDDNAYRDVSRNCFEALAGFCVTALERGTFHARELEIYTERLDAMSADREELLLPCIRLAKEKFRSQADK